MPEPRRDPQSTASIAAPDEKTPSALFARQEALLDEAVEETFPASDPIAPVRLL